ncbi:MAG: hypothetical protein JSU71_15285 [Betaproteobacteria bacterium]|nr:MAG: hypothetical protein AMJ67_09310 [Betaproteobacteria bacterium SG8_41]UCF75547.1 MAG: hypothetical protein JSU71_15285 [Betaproteobacteria bacterium]
MMVFKWRREKVDHLMADPKRARQLIEELPVNDAKALEEITEWLESISHTPGFKVDQRFDNVSLLDAAAKQRVRKLSLDYLSMPRQMKFQEIRLWTTIFGFWEQLGAAYLACADQYVGAAAGLTLIRRSLPLIVARAQRALTNQVKWFLLRYGPVEPRIWKDMARLYQIADKRGFTGSSIEIYPGSRHAGSMRWEFLKAMMLSVSSMDGLSPMRQEIAERVVAHFSSMFQLSKRPDGCTHCFGLVSPKAPVRIYKGAESVTGQLFFGAGKAFAALAELMERIRRSHEVPPEVDLGGSYHLDAVVGALQHLELCWNADPPGRSSERRLITGRITVVPGFSDAMQALDPSTSDELDFSQDEPAESWIVVNVSDGGYGAIIPGLKSDWIRVGTLIGMQSEHSSRWMIGLIRRIASDEHKQRHVGIQTLSRTAIPVRVVRAGVTGSLFNLGRTPQPAILLATAPDAQGEIGMIMREGIFSVRDAMEMTIGGKSYFLQPVRLVEGGEDFDWAAFRVKQKKA